MRLAFLTLFLAGCSLDPYHLDLTPGGDGGRFFDDGGIDDRDGGTRVDAGFDRRDGGDGGCGTEEICNGADDDCDGEPDNGFNLESDPANCGRCGNACARPGSSGTCEEGECVYGCLPNRHDNDGDPLNGCEYACVVTNGGVEICDDLDNDCDGNSLNDDGVDEDFDTMSSEDHCGGCNQRCTAVNADAVCMNGLCTWDMAAGCDDGFRDVTSTVNGCEYRCPVTPIAVEETACDGQDEDCDGVADDGNPEGGAACGDSDGDCMPGTMQCRGGNLVCVGGTGPGPELCDGADNNCDGDIDEPFDKDNDPRTCGPTCTACNLRNAVNQCTAGVCEIDFCLSGFHDLDGVDANGCEFGPCYKTGPEVCDGRDNDCNGVVDDPSTLAPPPANLCRTTGPCSSSTTVCDDAPGCGDARVRWRCVYSNPDVEKNSCGDVVLSEALCDGADGDCDGVADDTFPTLGDFCTDGKLGECAGEGEVVCTSDERAVRCDITDPGATATTQDLRCDGKDEDCDGRIDEEAVDSFVMVGTVRVDTYEASHPDATSTSEGTMTHRSCSRSGVLPWRNVSWEEADTACRASGKRLCTATEWQSACRGTGSLLYPYGNTYDPDACNGDDYDADCTVPDHDDQVRATGAIYNTCSTPSRACLTSAGIADMSGNLKEWTATVSTLVDSYKVRGGSFDNPAGGLTCTNDFTSLPDTFRFSNLGFRCCK
jgi:hypothetical protein